MLLAQRTANQVHLDYYEALAAHARAKLERKRLEFLLGRGTAMALARDGREILLFDRDPPIVGSDYGGTTENSGNTFPATYPSIGRGYYVGLNAKF